MDIELPIQDANTIVTYREYSSTLICRTGTRKGDISASIAPLSASMLHVVHRYTRSRVRCLLAVSGDRVFLTCKTHERALCRMTPCLSKQQLNVPVRHGIWRGVGFAGRPRMRCVDDGCRCALIDSRWAVWSQPLGLRRQSGGIINLTSDVIHAGDDKVCIVLIYCRLTQDAANCRCSTPRHALQAQLGAILRGLQADYPAGMGCGCDCRKSSSTGSLQPRESPGLVVSVRGCHPRHRPPGSKNADIDCAQSQERPHQISNHPSDV